ncbi:glycoside hydrolase [Enterococcus sp. JM4C]|uniref:sugar-binding domain-containing protein n=1 Tax=Candidatus Enterococcus huntleyi TaxID=1857217 RepID=UPI00137B33A6|nr:sugar-binding domain-containing protein [Enterococcus sp. JM4C]KAF1298330.1 glycoside hydrolase [Enterococcus sp. JM4C]
MRRRGLNEDWQFHLGAIDEPMKTVRKAGAIGGLTAPLADEEGEVVLTGAGGEHFLRLIAQGNRDKGLAMLAGTELSGQLSEDWQTVDVPHDWKNQLPYVNNPALLMSGSKPDGIGYYRKTFTLSEDVSDKEQVMLHFDGVMRMASVWLNGIFLGDHYSGYSDFSFDITELARYGEEGLNVLLVKVDTTTGAEGWWYEGAGIYKEVYLEFLPKVRIDPQATFIETKRLEEKKAYLSVSVGVLNQSFDDADQLTIKSRLSGHTEWLEDSIAALSCGNYSYELTVDNPKLWSPESPHLYTAEFQLLQAGEVIDEFHQTVGIRTVDYTEAGFYLNGKLTELRGVCEHQDFGGIGVALNKDILRYKLRQMKAMGVNAYRSAHHFASRELLTLCDELGMIVMNENRILESSDWRIAELERMVKQTRHHPSLCFWSLCNEEVIGNTPFANRMAKKLAAVVRKATKESLIVSAELLNSEGIVNEEYMSNFDVKGVNYPESGVNGAGLAKLKERKPDVAYLSTESASYFSTRGIYQDDETKCHTSNFGSLYSMVLPGKREPGEPGAGGTAHPEEVMDFLENQPYTGGVFLWTFMDYYGEPSPFAWPGISSQFGISDTVGFEKDYYYYYQAKWTAQPMVHLMPHWNSEGLELDQEGRTEVRVFSNCSEIELFVNDRSCGRKPAGKDSTTWQIPFEAGCLKAVGYVADQPVAETSKVTSGTIDSVAVTERFDGEEYTLVEVAGRDAQGNFVPMVDSLVTVACENGKIIGLANGNPADLSGFNRQEKRLFSGKLLAVVKKNKEQPIKVSAQLKQH